MTSALVRKPVCSRTPMLRRRVLDAALEILAESGPDFLNLRAIAERTGMAVASLYNYFADKDELVAQLAIQGFEQLERSVSETQPDNTGCYHHVAAHLDFARVQPALYGLMYSERLLSRYEGIRLAEARAFGAFRRAMCACETVDPDTVEKMAVASWALSRGTAAVAISRGDAGGPSTDVLQDVLQGLAHLAGPERRVPGRDEVLPSC